MDGFVPFSGTAHRLNRAGTIVTVGNEDEEDVQTVVLRIERIEKCTKMCADAARWLEMAVSAELRNDIEDFSFEVTLVHSQLEEGNVLNRQLIADLADKHEHLQERVGSTGDTETPKRRRVQATSSTDPAVESQSVSERSSVGGSGI